MEIGIISWLVVGLIAGILGKVIMPGRDPGGLLLTIVLGMIGTLVGGLIVAATRGHGPYGVQRLVDPGGHPWSNHIAGDLPTVRAFAANLNLCG
jgi:uncharacterized membrane protein YeaQ/YmgE (transglycosylase-associated protein family)